MENKDYSRLEKKIRFKQDNDVKVIQEQKSASEQLRRERSGETNVK